MADNVQIDEGSTTSIAADDIAGVKHQRVKIQFGADGSATDVSSSNKLPVDTGLTQPTTPSDTQPVSASSLPLPTGAATSAKQDTGNTSLSNIDTAIGAKADSSASTDTGTFSLISLFKRLLEKVTTLVAKDFSTETTLSALNTKIPASPATSAKQDTGNTSLSSIDGKLTDVATQTTLALIKAKTDNIPAQGQALAAASTPVVLTAAQLSTLTPPAAITGFATSAKQDTIIGHVDGIEALLTTIDADTGNIATEVAGLLTDAELRATPVPVSGTVTATPTGTQNVDVTANTIGLATSAKQDTLLAELQLKADLTETQPVSLASVPSHAVTNAGTFPVQATQSGTWNIGTVTTLTGITNALPAGTNAIGKLAANSGVDIGDVDVTSSVSATLDHGSNLDIDTTAEQITTTSFSAKFGVTVKAAVDNTDTVYIGNSDVTAGTTAATDGFPLEPGESITLPVNNSNLLYAIGAAANQKVFWSAV